MQPPTPEQIAYMQAHAGDDKRALFAAGNAVVLGIAYIAIVLRFVSRARVGTKYGWDDWLICLAAVFLTGHVTCLFVSVYFGMGQHMVRVSNPRSFAITALVAQTFYNTCIPTIKLSILLLYSRIFARTTSWLRPTLLGTGIFVIAYMIPQCLCYIFQCLPIYSLWTPGVEARCIDFKAVIVVFGIVNIVTDWWVLALPVPVVMGLRMQSRVKWSLCVLFTLGSFVCIISIIRLLYARNVKTVDPSWDYLPISFVSSLEGSSGILAACMPTYRPLFKFLRDGLSSFRSKSHSNKYANSSSDKYALEGSTGLSTTPKPSSRSRKEKRASSNPARKKGIGGGGGIVHIDRNALVPIPRLTRDQRSDTIMSGGSQEKIIRQKSSRDEEAGFEMDDWRGGDSPLPLPRTHQAYASAGRGEDDVGVANVGSGGIMVTRSVSRSSGEIGIGIGR